MTAAPLDRLDQLLPPSVLRVAARETPIPTIAVRAKTKADQAPDLVRADIGQITNVDPSVEVLYGPPVGLEPLRAAIAETYTRSFGLGGGALPGSPDGLRPENVVVCTGAAEGLSLLFKCFARDKAVGLPRGHWENYTNAVELADGRPVVVDYFDARGRLDAEGLARQIRDHGLSVLVANFPSNPTGAVLDEAESRALAAVVERAGVVLVADEVYARLRYDGAPPLSLLRFAPGHAVSVGSASKEYLLPGARVGYVVSTRPRLTDVVLRKLVRASTASPSVLGQTRLLELMQRDLEDLRAGREPGLVARIRDEMRARRDLLLEVLHRHGFATVGRPEHEPAGTIFLMAALPPWWSGTDVELVDAALDEACVSAIPGAAFGLPGSVRLSFGAMRAADVARLDRNLQRFRESLGERT
jgi:aspartate/methionine/tyrosine aminotransferase